MRKPCWILVGLLTCTGLIGQGAEPKRLLLVTTTAAFRHASIDVAERTIRELAEQSGEFVVVSTTDSPHYPQYPVPTARDLAGGRAPAPAGRPGGGGGAGPRIPGLADDLQPKVAELFAASQTLGPAASAARNEIHVASLSATGSADELSASAQALEAAELAWVRGRAEAVSKLKELVSLSADQVAALQQDFSRPRRGGPGGPGGPGGRRGGGGAGPAEPITETQRAALAQIDEQLAALENEVTQARTELSRLVHEAPVELAAIESQVKAVVAAEQQVATSRAAALRDLQNSDNQLTEGQLAEITRFFGFGLRTLAESRGRRGGGPPGFGIDPAQMEGVRSVLQEHLSTEALQNYDGVFFLHTTGQLPFPDMEAFLAWVKAGHGVMGSHAASDCFHESDHPGEPHSFIQMLGGEFAGHGAQETVTLHNVDPQHPAMHSIPTTFDAHDEYYLFKNYDQSRVHSLLNMNEHPNERTPGHFPVSWSKKYGDGRVFYTSLGHRHDVWDPAWKGSDGQRTNPPEVAEHFRRHLLGGIRWSLGLTGE